MNLKLEIPESFFQGEERSGYYVSPEMKKVWAVELDLLNEFARVCDKYNLKWYIAYGTLLGAVRHKGFVSWDDDVDIMMMRSDYERLCEISEEEFQHPYYLQSPLNDVERIQDFAKLHNEDTSLFEDDEYQLLKIGEKFSYASGIYIDIFPLYDIPDDDRTFMKIYKKATFLKWAERKVRGLSDKYYHTSPKKWKRILKALLHYVLRPLQLSKVCSKIFHLYMNTISSYVYPQSKRVADFWPILVPGYLQRMGLPRSYFAQTTYLSFEMLNLPAPSCYEELLHQWFGEWQTPKKTHVHGKFYDTERSYKYYLENGLLLEASKL